MAEPEYMEKTPARANRWFRAFILLSLLYGATFSLDPFFNWLFFCAAAYSLFMSYYLLPVQPKVFQQRRPRENFNYRPGDSQTTIETPAARARKVVFIIAGIMFVIFMIPFTIGLIEGFSEGGDESTTSYETTEASPSDFVAKGNDFFNDQQYDSADAYYDKALALDAGYAEAIYGKGIVLYQRDHRDQANVYFFRAYELGFRYAWLSWVLADTYDKQGQTSRAIQLYKESVNLDSTYVDSYARLAELEPANQQKYLELAQKYAAN